MMSVGAPPPPVAVEGVPRARAPLPGLLGPHLRPAFDPAHPARASADAALAAFAASTDGWGGPPPPLPPRPLAYVYVDTRAGLEAAGAAVARAGRVALDTEHCATRSYRGFVALLQVRAHVDMHSRMRSYAYPNTPRAHVGMHSRMCIYVWALREQRTSTCCCCCGAAGDGGPRGVRD